MKTVAVIQARMGSTRLPGKALRLIAGETMLARVVRRVCQASLLDEVVVATSVEPADMAIVAECERLGIPFFRGSEDDVLDRYYQAAQAFQAEAVVRITADCPLIDAEVIDQVVQTWQQTGADYVSNVLTARTYPRGLDTEVFSLATLSRAWQEAADPFQRVHVTPYIYQNPHLFFLKGITVEGNYGRYRWTVDTLEDWQFVQAVYAHFAPRSDFGWRDVLQLLANEPDLQMINAHIEQKELRQG